MGSENWTRENLAWMAGFFEGEGSFGWRTSHYVHPNGRSYDHHNLSLTIPQNELEVLETFLDLAGGGTIAGPYINQSGNQFWRYQASGRYAFALIIAMWQWLHGKRREEARGAIVEWCKHTRHKVPADTIREIRSRVAAGEMQKDVAADLGLDKRFVSAVITGKRYSSIK